MHEGGHIFDGVFRGHLLHDSSLVIIEELYRMLPLFVIVVDRVDVVGIFGEQRFVERLSLGNLLNEVGNDLVIFGLPRLLS